MASSSPEGPSPKARQEQFEQGVAISLHLWQSLTIAVQNNWGGPDSSDKRDWLAGVIVDMFPSFTDLVTAASTSSQTNDQPKSSEPQPNKNKLPDEPIAEEIEETLLQVMFDEFEANIDDQSEAEVADRIMKCRAQCAAGDFSLVGELRARWLDTKGKKVVAQAAAEQEQDTDWDSDEDDEEGDENEDGDVDMDEAPPLVAVAPKEKPQPQIDEDGFELVPSRRKK
ncbi:Pre-rRNA-processing protein TSR2-domain-containing protein [Poronia punctata]|nr:Pre-rRNA-processing protein TSR2-domain-containing protein [Poronia punctata]